jgi:hypothetical protein
MSMGAQRADAQPEDGTADTHEDWGVLPAMNGFVDAGDWPVEEPEEHPRRAACWDGCWRRLRSPGRRLPSGRSRRRACADAPNALQWMSFVAPPLILLGIAWIILGQTPRKETERFTRAVAALRTESSALESVLAIVATRLEKTTPSFAAKRPS